MIVVYILQFLFCSMHAHVLQAPLNLNVAVANVSNYKNTQELYYTVSCIFDFFCPPGSERCSKIESKRVFKTRHNFMFASNSFFNTSIFQVVVFQAMTRPICMVLFSAHEMRLGAQSGIAQENGLIPYLHLPLSKLPQQPIVSSPPLPLVSLLGTTK
jgi:hypothetical protein